jgi:GT2 family glycosyltransferase
MISSNYIIIVTYNGAQWIRQCLDSCLGYNVIVVDNNSTDETVSFIEANYPNITLLKQQKNLGFGRANNLGISHALKNGCDYVFLLNQDAYLEKDAIDRMVAVHKKNLEYGILSPTHLNGAGNKLDRNFSNYLSYDSNNHFFHDAIKQQLKSVYSVPFVNAAAWLLPVSTLKMIGGFDPIFFHYGEDDNYCQRALFHSLKIGIISNAFIRHDRENIIKRPVLNYTDKLKKMSIGLKLEWGNINKNINGRINSREKSLLKKTFRNFILLRYTKGHHYYLEFKLIRSIKNDIYISRNTNTEKGNNYLIKRNE